MVGERIGGRRATARCIVVSASGIHVELNPRWLDPASHIDLLNQGFPGHWNRAAYDWYIARPFRAVENDTLVVTDGCRILSVITLCYRQVGTDTSPPIDVAVMSSAATQSCERGRGHYGRLLQAARERALARGYAALLGFVTRDNVSAKGLAHRGARAIPSFYIVSVPGRGAARRPNGCRLALAAAEHAPAALAHGKSAPPGTVRFLYQCASDWRRQFLERPSLARVVRLTHDSLALLETVGETDRLQWLASPRDKVTASIARLANASAATGKRFFLYTLDPLIAAAARRIGFGARPGYLMLWPTGCRPEAWSTLANASWTVQSGDRL